VTFLPCPIVLTLIPTASLSPIRCHKLCCGNASYFIWRLLSTEACGLINLRGQQDSWIEVDLHNEHLNPELKTLLNARRNGTFDVDSLFEYGVPCCGYSTATMKFLESSLRERTVGSHTIKNAVSDIRFLADLLKDSSIVQEDSSPDYAQNTKTFVGTPPSAFKKFSLYYLQHPSIGASQLLNFEKPNVFTLFFG
jgi:uncharacterized protein DUF6589